MGAGCSLANEETGPVDGLFSAWEETVRTPLSKRLSSRTSFRSRPSITGKVLVTPGDEVLTNPERLSSSTLFGRRPSTMSVGCSLANEETTDIFAAALRADPGTGVAHWPMRKPPPLLRRQLTPCPELLDIAGREACFRRSTLQHPGSDQIPIPNCPSPAHPAENVAIASVKLLTLG